MDQEEEHARYPDLHVGGMVNRKEPQIHYLPQSAQIIVDATAPDIIPDTNQAICTACSHILGERSYLTFQCLEHNIHEDCAGKLAAFGQPLLPYNCYDCHNKGRANYLEYKDNAKEKTINLFNWAFLIGWKNVLMGRQEEMSLDMLKENGHNLIRILRQGIPFSNLMYNLRGENKPTFAEMVNFGLVPKIFEPIKFRKLIPLNRVLSTYKLTYGKLKKHYQGIFDLDVNRLHKMGADEDTLQILNLDAPLLAQLGAKKETIINLNIPYRTWADELRLDHSLMVIWNLKADDFQ